MLLCHLFYITTQNVTLKTPIYQVRYYE